MPPFSRSSGTIDPPGSPSPRPHPDRAIDKYVGPKSDPNISRKKNGVRYSVLETVQKRLRRPSPLGFPQKSDFVDRYHGLQAFKDSPRDESCVGSVGAKLVEAQFRLSGLNIGERDPEFLWRVAKQRDGLADDRRTSLYEALTVAADYGIPPFKEPGAREIATAKALSGEDVDQTFVDKTLIPLLLSAASARIKSVVSLGADFGDWKTYILERGPLAVQLNVDPENFRQPSNEDSPKGDLPWVKMRTHLSIEQLDSHAIVVLDYVVPEKGPPYFVFLNSFGTGWGADGFAKISEEDAQVFFVRAFGVELINPQRPL